MGKFFLTVLFALVCANVGAQSRVPQGFMLHPGHPSTVDPFSNHLSKEGEMIMQYYNPHANTNQNPQTSGGQHGIMNDKDAAEMIRMQARDIYERRKK